METQLFNETTKAYFKAVKNHSLLIVTDSASKGAKAVFSLVYWDGKQHRTFAAWLKELGFKQHRNEDDLFVTYCAGRFGLFILDNIGQELKGKGVKLPKWYFNEIQNQSII